MFAGVVRVKVARREFKHEDGIVVEEFGILYATVCCF